MVANTINYGIEQKYGWMMEFLATNGWVWWVGGVLALALYVYVAVAFGVFLDAIAHREWKREGRNVSYHDTNNLMNFTFWMGFFWPVTMPVRALILSSINLGSRLAR